MDKNPLTTLHQHIREQAIALFGNAPFFILGVSGGPDSMALMYMFHQAGLRGLVVHVNYQKRGKASELDQELTEQMASAWGFECVSVRLNPDDAGKQNFQNWAREQRYTFFRDLKREYNADAIVCAHHEDDQIETILQKVLRGSSPVAWQGMQEWDGEIYRPLLHFSKQQILDFCAQQVVPYRTDQSNLETGFARNLIRHKLASELDKFFPGWKQNLLQLPKQGRMFAQSLETLAQSLYNSNNQLIHRETYLELPEMLRAAVLKHIIDRLKPGMSYTKAELENLTAIGELQTGKQLKIGSLVFIRNRDEIQIQDAEAELKQGEFHPVEITKSAAEKRFIHQNIELNIASGEQKGDLFLNAETLQWPLTLRRWQVGDAFKPAGLKGRQKISDHLTNRKISTHLKEKTLVLCGSDSTIYAIIYPEPAGNLEKGAVTGFAETRDHSQNYLTIKIH